MNLASIATKWTSFRVSMLELRVFGRKSELCCMFDDITLSIAHLTCITLFSDIQCNRSVHFLVTWNCRYIVLSPNYVFWLPQLVNVETPIKFWKSLSSVSLFKEIDFCTWSVVISITVDFTSNLRIWKRQIVLLAVEHCALNSLIWKHLSIANSCMYCRAVSTLPPCTVNTESSLW